MRMHAIIWVTSAVFCLAIEKTGLAEDLASLREKITNNLSTIGSIEVRYQRIAPPMADPMVLKHWVPEEKPAISVWAKQGEREFFELETYPLPQTKRFLRKKASFDGRQYVEFHYSPENPDVVVDVDVRNKPPRDATTTNIPLPPKLIGMQVASTQVSLIDLLRRPAAHYAGPEDIEGNLCHKIELGELDSPTDYVHALTIWVDPTFDFLPRKIENLMVRQKSTDKQRAPYGDRHQVSEFFEVDDLALKRKRWFPKRVLGSAPLEILQARINPVFEPARFSLIIPDGAYVRYHDQRVPAPGANRTRMRAEIFGGAAGTEIAKNRSQENAQKLRDEQVQTNQRTDFARTLRFWGISFGCVLAFVFVSVVVWKRSSLRSR